MGYVYLLVSAVLVLLSDGFFEIFRQSYSWWLVPLLLLAFWIGLVLIHVLIVVIMIFTVDMKKPPKGTKFFRLLIKTGLPIVLKLARVKIEAEGIEKLPQEGRMLVVCNHQHDFDPVIIVNSFPDAYLSFIGKKEIYETMPFAARAMHWLECLPIDRENDREAAKTIIKAIKRIKDDEGSIALFPEGYVSKSCELLPFRNGSLKIALKSQVPVVVCVINGTRVMAKSLFRRKSTVQFRLLDVINPEDYAGMNTAELGGIIHEKMQTALDEIRNT